MEERISRWVAELERLQEVSEELFVGPEDFEKLIREMKEAMQPVAL